VIRLNQAFKDTF